MSLNTLYRFFKSVRLAVVLLLVITVFSVLATLVPQGREEAFYQASYPVAVYRLVTVLHFDRFFSSILFLIPVFLFTLNLAVCTVDRFLRRARSRTPKRYGPDLVHIGLLLLILGSLASVLARQEKNFSVASGDEVTLSKTYSIKLLSMQFLRYENGSPKAWISTVRVFRNGNEEIPTFPIRVNHPLRLPGVAVYQTTWEDKGTLTLKDDQGNEAKGRPGQGLQDGESYWYFSDIIKDGEVLRAAFREYRGNEVVSTRMLATADRIGPYTVTRIESIPMSGLKAVNDPGYLLVIVAVIVLAAGLGLTYFQKKREEKP
jgi:cytochrome c biogenesis protein